MSVPPEVSLETIQAELKVAVPYAAASGIALETANLAGDHLRFIAVFINRDNEAFPAEFDCIDYPLYPPTIEFLNEDHTERGHRHLYPKGFHPTPCICMRYNRKAYGSYGGPHGNWRLVDWQLATSGGGPIDSLAMMFSDLNAKIRNSSGRIG